MQKLIFPICILMTTISHQAFAKDSTDVALQLGTVLASETFCNLSYNHEAIDAYVQKNVSADDMGFPSMLDMMTQGSEIQLRDMSSSSKAAHCTQMRRIAKSYGFVN